MKTDITNLQATKALPQLVKGSTTYKLVVPEKVERKIRYLLRKFPSTEWSGVLFTSHTGTFENGDLTITCEDIYPMDLGDSVYTEFQMNEDVAAYMAENIELFDCELQLVHSHHNMTCTPSGTDLKTLQEEGNERNCFVSLIVNNAGTYYAAVTRKVHYKSEVTVKDLGSSYAFFGEGTKGIDSVDQSCTKTIEKEVIEYFDCKVERHTVVNDLEYLDARFEEIKTKKATPMPIKDRRPNWDMEVLNLTGNPQEGNLFERHTYGQHAFNNDYSEDETPVEWYPDPDKVHRAVVNMITCSLNINPDNVDLKHWIKKHLENTYKRIFGQDCLQQVGQGWEHPFNVYKDFIAEFMSCYFFNDDIPEELREYTEYTQSQIASAMMSELQPYTGMSPFLKEYYDMMEEYLID